MELTFLQILWFLLIFVLITGYFVLDGFDLGIGTAYPFLAKTEKERAVLRTAVGPVWDGNEVWLLTAGGALFAAFAPAYATTFSGFYLAIMLVLFGLILRAVSLEFHAHDPKYSKVWDTLFFLGSAVPALLFGVAVGNVINGLPLNANGDYMGSFFALLNPFSLLCGLLGLCMILSLGMFWVAIRTNPCELRERAMGLAPKFLIAALVLFVLASVLYFTVVTPVTVEGAVPVLRYVFAVVVLAGIILALVFAKGGAHVKGFFATCVGCVGLVALTAATLFPLIVPSTDPSTSVSIANAASSEASLLAMTIITCIGLPLVLIYHVIVYRTFTHKIEDEDLHY